MDWIKQIQNVLNHIEDHILEDMNADTLAQRIFTSQAYLQKMFPVVTGYTISDYIRNRRLSLAGEELVANDSKIIDIAYKYGYESAESFTKAFVRFHGVTPSVARKNNVKLKYFYPLLIQINVKGGFVTSRRLIPNAEKLYENRAENYMFPSCMRSAMCALNEDARYDFSFFAGVCGDFFTQIWLEPKWRYNDSYSNVCKHTQLPLQYAFDACGYDYTYVSRDDIQKNIPLYLSKITESIDKGLPVLTFGIVGPPVCSIIYGYAEDGRLLIGWSQFSGKINENELPDHEFSENYFEVENGLLESEALIFFGGRKNRPSIEESLRNSLRNIKKLASLTSDDTMKVGKDAFDAWADSLLCDEEFQTPEQMEGALDTYQSCVVQTGTNLYHLDDYLTRVKEAWPERKEVITQFACLIEEERNAFEALIAFQGGYFFERDRAALYDKAFRIDLAQHVRNVGMRYHEAISYIIQKRI